MNSAPMNLTYQRAKRHAAWLLQDAEEDQRYEQAVRRARARRNRQRRAAEGCAGGGAAGERAAGAAGRGAAGGERAAAVGAGAPLEEAITARSRDSWHLPADETSWHVLAPRDGDGLARWWPWAFIGPDTTCFVMDPTRAGTVLARHAGIDDQTGQLAGTGHGSWSSPATSTPSVPQRAPTRTAW